MALNKWMGIGRLVREAEVRHTPSGTEVSSFSIAVSRQFKKGEETGVDFINVVAWRETAKFVANNFAKGDPIQIEGRIQTRNYTDKHGENRVAFEIIAENVTFVEGYRRPLADEKPKTSTFEELSGDDDLPF